MNKQKTFYIMSEHRNVVYAIAIISIVLFHYCCIIRGDVLDSSFLWRRYMRYIGSVGVELFLFLSGMGLYYSMKRSNVKQFWIKRFLRISIPYLIVGVTLWGFRDLYQLKAGISVFLKDFFWISFLADGNNQFWYVLFIIMMYAIYPLIYMIINKKHGSIYWGILLIGDIVFNYVIQLYFPDFFKHTEIALTRVPIFLIGCYIGVLIYNNRRFNVYVAIMYVVASFGLMYCAGRFLELHSPLSRYVAGIYGIGVCLLIVIVVSLIPKLSALNIIWNWIEPLTYEIYLWSVALWGILAALGWHLHKFSVYCVLIAITIVLSVATNWIFRIIQRKCI